MGLQQSRHAFHSGANRVEAYLPRLLRKGLFRGEQVPAGAGELLASDWLALDAAARGRVARRATAIGFSAALITKLVISVETFVLVLLAFNGGRLSLRVEHSHPDYRDMLIAVIVGSVASTVLAIVLLRPQLDWFVTGEPADAHRRRAVGRLPLREALADVSGWAVSFGVYALVADITGVFLATVGTAFALAAVTSGSLTFLFTEWAARPLTVLALRGSSQTTAVHGVRERMIVVWLVSSAVPMSGLVAINVGRWFGWLPEAATPFDWATILLAIVALTSGLNVILLVSRAIADPLKELRGLVEAATDGDFDRRVAVYDTSELGILQSGLNTMLEGLSEREHIRELFSKHVGGSVAELAIAQAGEMTGVNTDVAVIFVDLSGSTAFAAQRDPRETAVVLNVFFSVVAEVVDRYDGFINKFEGDAALIVFGAPQPLDDPAGRALRAAREMGEALSAKVPLEWGMGVGYGRVFAGNIGAASRYEYTVIGDPVNEAARLSDSAKQDGAPVRASGATVFAADRDEAELWAPIGTYVLRGRATATEVYAPGNLVSRSAPPALSSVLSDLMKLGRSVIR